MTSKLLVLFSLALNVLVDGHPICFVGDRPTDAEQVLTFCPAQSDGACCNDIEELAVKARFEEAEAMAGELGTCGQLYKESLCGICNSYSGHLYADLSDELGVEDGLAMKKDFCEELVNECSGLIDFPDYDGVGYCNKHTKAGEGDYYWSYPYEEVEVPVGLVEFFDGNGDIPHRALDMAMTPDGNFWWVAGKIGEIVEVSVNNLGSGETVLDLGDRGDQFHESYEEGLMGFAFGPAFEDNGRFYVAWNTGDTGSVRSRLSMFERLETAELTLASEEILLETSIKDTPIHSGGWVGFKPSDYGNGASEHDLYWSLGDAGPQKDTNNNGQNLDRMHGKMIRITVPISGAGYVPSGNYPGALPEICAIGLRNPWRCSFDRVTEELYCGDVGHTDVESVNIIECGKNYGWGRFEGSLCQEAAQDVHGPCSGADRSGIEFPWFEYCHPDYNSAPADQDEFTGGVDFCAKTSLSGHAVIGGFVYRGNYFDEVLGGAYVFGDSQNRNVYFIKEVDGVLETGTIISDRSLAAISFAQDNDGELYVIDTRWDIYRLPCGDLCAGSCLDQAPNPYTYTAIGCYDEDTLSLDQAPECSDGEGAMSPQICADYCATTVGSEIFGVKNFNECYCGTNGDISGVASISGDQCVLPCTGSPDFTCGGEDAIEVFELGETVETTPTPVDTPMPTTPAPVVPVDPIEVDGHVYLGCYVDSEGDRTLTGKFVKGVQALTTEYCADFCSGFDYFGTEYGQECYCGLATDTFNVMSMACTKTCKGDDDQICGGNNAISIYEGTGELPPVPEGYLGCYGDMQDDRIFGDKITSIEMDLENCAQHCIGNMFYGVQYGKECWCGPMGADYAKHGISTACTKPCMGNNAQTCGGGNAMDVYEYV